VSSRESESGLKEDERIQIEMKVNMRQLIDAKKKYWSNMFENYIICQKRSIWQVFINFFPQAD